MALKQRLRCSLRVVDCESLAAAVVPDSLPTPQQIVAQRLMLA